MEGSEEPVPEEAAPPEPRPALTDRDLRPDRQLPISGELLGLVVVVALGILMAGFILGRVTAPDADEESASASSTTVASTFPFPAGDVDRSGYWRFRVDHARRRRHLRPARRRVLARRGRWRRALGDRLPAPGGPSGTVPRRHDPVR